MSHIVIPGCSAPGKILFRANSTLDEFFKQFDELTRSAALRSILVIVTLYSILNIFHLIILTRPQMKTISVSKEMILIAASGVVNGVVGVVKNIVEIFEDEYFCVHSNPYNIMVLIHSWLFQVMNQIILLEIVHITFLRAAIILDVRHGIKTEKIKLAMRTFISLLFLVFLVNQSIRIGLHRIMEADDMVEGRKEVDGKVCPVEKVYTVRSIAGNCLRRILFSVTAVTSLLIPIFIMLVLSVFLICELQTKLPTVSTSSSTTFSQSANRQNTAARALLVFLCFYVLAQLPYALLYGVGLYNPADFEQLDEYIYTQVDIFIYTNMCLGILVYCLMSSQYRETIRSTFWRRKSSAVGDPSSRSTR